MKSARRGGGQRYALSHDGKAIALATMQDIRGEQLGYNGPQCDLAVMLAEGEEARKVGRFPGRVALTFLGS